LYSLRFALFGGADSGGLQWQWLIVLPSPMRSDGLGRPGFHQCRLDQDVRASFGDD